MEEQIRLKIVEILEKTALQGITESEIIEAIRKEALFALCTDELITTIVKDGLSRLVQIQCLVKEDDKYFPALFGAKVGNICHR